jgi:hypothetical protein
MISVEMVLLILALVCFLVSCVGVVTRVNLQSLGLALLVLALLLGGRPPLR